MLSVAMFGRLLDDVLDPARRQLHIVIDARLMVDAATETGARDADQRVAAASVAHNQRSAGIAEAGVLMAVRMAGAEHFVKQLDVDLLALVPFDAVVGAWLICDDFRLDWLIYVLRGAYLWSERLHSAEHWCRCGPYLPASCPSRRWCLSDR